MDRKQAEDYIYASYMKAVADLPYGDPDRVKRNPDYTRALLASMSRVPSVGVTGSKGKGSVACMLSALLQAGGRKTGLLTSPHIFSFNERFRIDGEAIPDGDLSRIVTRLAPLFDRISRTLPAYAYISPIGIQAAVGLEWFNEQGTDINVFEYGKGARYDDVNNLPHKYAIINTLFLEHTRELGSTLELIAEDKSYAIQPALSDCFVAGQCDSVRRIFTERARKLAVPLWWYGRDFRAENIRYTDSGMAFDFEAWGRTMKDVCIPLLGEHQARNCSLALAASYRIQGGWNESDVRSKLSQLQWPGRMEVLSASPLVVLDACINRASTGMVLDVLGHLSIDKCVWIVGIPDDKDFAGVVQSVQGKSAQTILTRSQNPHYRFTDLQRRTLSERGIKTMSSSSVVEAMDIALQYRLPVIILGTTSLVAEVKQAQRSNRLFDNLSR